MLNIVLNFSLSLFMSITLVPLLMKYAKTLRLVDMPDSIRKQHKQATPKTGGLAISIAVLLPLIYLSPDISQILPLVTGGVIIALVGYLDDIFNIGSWKFLGQFISVSIFIFATPGLTQKDLFFFENIPQWASQVIIFVFLVGATNAINLADGLDGLAAGLALLSVVLIALFANEAGIDSITWISMALIGALMGFLRFNTHPAKVFMGDTGSQFIGFIAAALAISATQHANSAISPILPIFIIGLPITDTLMVFSLRIWQGKSPFSADRNHIHHQLLSFGLHSYEAVAVMYLIQMVFIVSAYLLRYESDLMLALIFLVLTLSILAGLFIATIKNYKYREANTSTQKVERRNPVFRKFNWVYIFSTDIISVSLLVCWILLVAFSWGSNQISIWPALCAIIIGVSIAKFLPNKNELLLRVLSYSASGMALYAFATSQPSYTAEITINILLFCISAFLIFAIKMTRKEYFQINNHDILILIILLIAPLVSLNPGNPINLEIMILRTAVIIYSIEYIISKYSGKELALKFFSTVTLIVVLISQY